MVVVVSSSCCGVQEYKRFFDEAMQAIDAEMSELSSAETRWIEHWHSAIEKVKQLY